MRRIGMVRKRDGRLVPFDTRKHKRPLHFVVSLLRQTRARITEFGPLQLELIRMGQVPFNWSPPDGYPDSVDAWGTSVLERWSFAARLLGGEIDGVSVPSATLDELRAGTAQGVIAERLSAFLTGAAMPASAVQRIQAYADGLPSFDEPAFRELIALAASSPSYPSS